MIRKLATIALAALTAVALTVVVLTARSWAAADNAGPEYPPTKRVEQVDRYHGVAVDDPYRWLEATDDPAVRSWAETQNRVTRSFVRASPQWESIRTRIAELQATGDLYGVPRLGGGRYVYTVSEPGFGAIVFKVRDGLAGEERLLFDPNPELAEGEAVSGDTLSPGGRYLGYRVATDQSRWGELRILEVATGRVGERLTGLRNASVGWLPDDSGFYYVYYGDSARIRDGAAYPAPEVRFHRLGEAQSKDLSVLPAARELEHTYAVSVVGRRPYLVVSLFEGTLSANRLLISDLSASGGPVVEPREIVDGSEPGIYRPLGAADDGLYVFTNAGAPNGRIVVIDPERPERTAWREIVPEGPATIAAASTAGGNAIQMIGRHLTLVSRRANQAWLRVYALDGRLEHEIELEAGWIGSGLVGGAAEEVWYSFSGLLEPQTVYRLDFATGRAQPFFAPETPIDRSDYVTRQVHYPSEDGTEVPLFIAHRRDLELDGSAPLFIYGYGLGGWVAVPWYQPQMLTWMDRGGVYAMPGIRGGGEYGDAWEEAGTGVNRQTAIDDYIAAAEWLVEQRYTSKGRIAANGWSASGALAAAAVQQRPDLYGAGVIGIPSLDLLRYERYTPFKGWTRGFGSVENSMEFTVLRSYSPYHNVSSETCYPPFIVTVGEKDDITPPQHGYKFVARMQQEATCS